MADAISPDHYKGFSNGAEPIDITENLNSNGGQLVQYGVRATRLDGHVKSDPVEDLFKAGWFAVREAWRQSEDKAAFGKQFDEWLANVKRAVGLESPDSVKEPAPFVNIGTLADGGTISARAYDPNIDLSGRINAYL